MAKAVLYASVMILSCGFALGQAQEKVLYNFCSDASCVDGGPPAGSLVFDQVGNLFGTTSAGGAKCPKIGGCGTVYELSPNTDGRWTHTILYSFCSVPECADGKFPLAGLIFDKAGNLYGTASRGGAFDGGTVFELSPPSAPGGVWTGSVLWSFTGPRHGDGILPAARLTFDAAGNLYGTTNRGLSIVFQLVPPPLGGKWTENRLSTGFNSGVHQGLSNVVFDKLGNLYFTGSGYVPPATGVYELSPTVPPPWKGVLLYDFNGRGGYNPLSGVVFDEQGYMYGTVSEGTSTGCGGVFRINLTGNGRKENVLAFDGTNGCTPSGGVLVHGDTLYGTTQAGGAFGGGTLFEIHYLVESVLYSFCSQSNCADGSGPNSDLVSDGTSLFGTAPKGGANGAGVVFQITP